MAQPPTPPPGPNPAGSGDAARVARELAQALGMDVGDGAGAAVPPASAGAEEGTEAGKLKLDRSGALLGLAKLKPVLAHGRADAEDAAAATLAQQAARQADAAATQAPGAPRKATLPPRIGSYVPPGFPGQGEGDAADVDEVEIPGGRFLFGEEREVAEVPAFRIDATPVTNAAYERFVLETGHRPPLYWPAGRLPEDLRDHPVVGVDYFDALAYARWLEKDLPFEDEWERAARGTDGRVWPWGNDGDQPYANTARSGIKMTLPVGFHPQNVSADGVIDLVGNVWELTHSPAPGGGLVVRGGSWYDLAYHAKAWFRFAARATARNGTIGFRCVKRATLRSDEPREVDPAVLEAEIAARRGPQAPVDPSGFSADRRDLVPDFRRLRILVAEQKAEEVLGPLRGPAPRHEPLVRVGDGAVPPPAARAHTAPVPTPAAARRAAVQGTPPAAPTPERQHVPSGREMPVLRPPSLVTATPPTTGAGADRTESAPPPAPPAPSTGSRPAPAAASGHAATSDRLAVARAAEDAARAVARAPAEAALRQAAARTPLLLWVLLLAGFALLVGVLYLVLRESPKAGLPDLPGVNGPEAAPRPRLTEIDDLPGDLPSYPAGGRAPSDGRPPSVLDASDPAWFERVREGRWLLVFAGGPEAEAAVTRRTAHALHRRFDGKGVQVALVLTRRFFERADGTLLGTTEVQASLEAMDARDGITVLLDPVLPEPGSTGREALRQGRFDLRSENAAVLLSSGRVQSKSSPPEGGMDIARLLPIARKAWSLAK